MRRVTLGASGIETSCLGFGCASLGSRVAAGPGKRALAAALDAGVSWLDLAPLYGGGRAEEIAGEVIRARRDRVQVCTKVGLAPGTPPGGVKAALLPAARAAVAAVPALRGLLRRGGAQPARRLALTPETLAGSLEASLRRLGTDHVDLYALHDPDPAALADPEVLRALEAILASGKARAVAVAGDAAAGAAAVARGAPFTVVQAALPPPGAEDALIAAAGAAGFGRIVHSVFGVSGSLAALRARAAADPAFAARLPGGGEGVLARLMLERAFARVPDGVVLVSMFSPESLARNLGPAERPPDPAAAERLDGLLGGAQGASGG